MPLIRIGAPLLLAACLVACSNEQTMEMPLTAFGSGGVGVTPPAGAPVGQAGGAAFAGNGSPGIGPIPGPPQAGSAGVPALAGAGGQPAAGAGGTGMAGTGGSAAGSGVSGMGGTGGMAGMPMAGQAGAAGSAGSGSPEDYEPCPATGACKILPLGDSITFGIGYDGGYRVELFHEAHAAGQEITFTGSLANGPSMVDGAMFPRNNEGHSGWKIDQLVPLIPSPALQDKPHIILLMIGTNDIGQNDDVAHAPDRLGKLIDLLIKNVPDALIVVATLTPLGFGGDAVPGYNAAIPAIVDARRMSGKHVVLVDMFKDFPTSELGDGVHPNQQGYERMAGVWYDAIGGVLP